MRQTEHRFRAMGTRCHVVLAGIDGADGADAATLAEAEVRRLESLWSRFVADSDVTRLNDAAGAPVTVHPDTATLLRTACDAMAWTHGWFDPFMQREIVAAGYDRTFDTLPAADALVAALTPDAPAGVVSERPPPIEFDDDTCSVALSAGAGFDPGGIGKGLAADLVATMLRDRGVAGVLVNIGGDLRCDGPAPRVADTSTPYDAPPGWRIGIDDPFDPDAPAVSTVRLVEGGLATSTPLKRRWRSADGSTAHHVLDPRTRRPSAVDVASVTVIAHDAWRAEVLATAVLLAGPTAGARMLRAADAGAVVVTLDGAVRQL